MVYASEDIENAIIALCVARGVGKTICPSEAARALSSEEETWRLLMPDVRRVAQDMAERGQIGIFKKGQQVEDHSTQGVIRLGLCRPGYID